MPDLFNEIRTLDLESADVVYHLVADLGIDPDILFQRLRSGIAWQQHAVRIHDQTIPQHRLSSWHGEVLHTYSTLAHVLVPEPFDPLLDSVRARVEALAGARLNSMLANLYRDGSDAIGWHSDDECGFRGHPGHHSDLIPAGIPR